MRRTLARFAVVGTVVTVVDIGVLVVLRMHGVVVADAIAVALATTASYVLHRMVTFRGDPYDRWLGRTRQFHQSALAGLVVDVAVMVSLAGLHPSMPRLVAAKVVAIGVAGVVRWFMHRHVLFNLVRDQQRRVPGRVPSVGSYRLSVVVPAYEEADRVGDTIAAIRRDLAALGPQLEIVVVDDGSTDDTAGAARAAGADLVLRQPQNRGKGAAVRAGMLAAGGSTVAFTDADLAYAPVQLLGLLAEIEAGWDVVVGSRTHEATRTLVRRGHLREVGGRAVNYLTHLVLLGHYRDTQCGLKAFRGDVARSLFGRARIDGFAFDVEVFALAERDQLAVCEVPVSVENTTRSTVHVVRDAARLVRDLFRIRRWAREGAYQDSLVPDRGR